MNNGTEIIIYREDKSVVKVWRVQIILRGSYIAILYNVPTILVPMSSTVPRNLSLKFIKLNYID